MSEANPSNVYFVWGVDEAPYGPVDAATLASWVRDERVVPDTWIYSRAASGWERANKLPELKELFNAPPAEAAVPLGNSIKPGSLRRIKILADLSEQQLAHLATFLELQPVKQWATVFAQGDASDAMYLVMAGELRARVMAAGRETILATFGPGEFFGDMALFDHGPRSADVLANFDSSLLKISSSAFDRMTREAPALATPFLQATARTLAARIRNDNKRLARMTQQYSAGQGI